METWQVLAVAIIGSGGLWTFLTWVVQRRMEKNDVKTQMLLGLGHDKIYELCEKYIDRWQKEGIGISPEEHNNLIKYLYKPYKRMNGNGTVDWMVQQVEKIPKQTRCLKDFAINSIDGLPSEE